MERRLVALAAVLLPHCAYGFAPAAVPVWALAGAARSRPTPCAPAMLEASERDVPRAGLSRRAALRRGAGAAILPCLLAGGSRPASAQLYVPSDGSELAPIAKDGKPSPILLVPLLQAQQQLESVAELIESSELASWKKANAILGVKPFAPTKELKRLFNAYSDNIYFDGNSSRKNMYLDGSAMLGQAKSTFGFGTMAVGAGGASPESKDTMTYLYRNEVRVCIEWERVSWAVVGCGCASG
jgi:hypothetical protein